MHITNVTEQLLQKHSVTLPEAMRPINMDGQRFLDSVGERLSSVSGDPRDITFLC